MSEWYEIMSWFWFLQLDFCSDWVKVGGMKMLASEIKWEWMGEGLDLGYEYHAKLLKAEDKICTKIMCGHKIYDFIFKIQRSGFNNGMKMKNNTVSIIVMPTF